MCKCYHLTQKPVRALGWKASAVLASLISHPSLILSVTQSAWLQCSSGFLLQNLDVACGPREAVSAPAGTTALAWAGASNEAAWEAAICRKPLGSSHNADVALDRAKDGVPSILPRACPMEQKQVISKDGRVCFLFEHSEQLCKDLCCRWPSYSWNCQQPQKSAPPQRITESKNLCLTSSLPQDISLVVLLKLSVIPF